MGKEVLNPAVPAGTIAIPMSDSMTCSDKEQGVYVAKSAAYRVINGKDGIQYAILYGKFKLKSGRVISARVKENAEFDTSTEVTITKGTDSKGRTEMYA